jgi:tRNA threonylcarbamoyladenosine biosynthesis protein TsaB
MLLAIDTATRYLSVALHDHHVLLGEQTLYTANRHNTLLATSIQQMLAVADVPISTLTHLAVATGPGSYTGLRIGIALAKGMAATHGLPLIGITTLDILAAAQVFQNTRSKLLAVVQAGRGRVIAGEYRVKKGRWQAENDPISAHWEELLAGLDGSFIITGEVDQRGHDAIEAAREKGVSITLAPPVERLRRAGYLAHEAWRRFEAGSPEDFDAARVLPVYVNSAD